MIIRNLTISTNIRLHPEFVADPRAFARQRKVNLAGDVFPTTDFRTNPVDPGNDERIQGNDERIQITRSNVHLVRHGAIRLFTECDAEGNWVRSIDLNPSMLLYEKNRHLLAANDLPLSLSMLKKQVTPLLADPLDARHIVPGLMQGDKDHVAYWSEVDTEMLFPGIEVRCFHSLSHPLTGPAEGTKPDRIQLADKIDDCLIRIKKTKREADGPDGARPVDGVRIRLILRGGALAKEFEPFAKTVKMNSSWRLVRFRAADLPRVHQAVMARMAGKYLPVPSEWKDAPGNKRLTSAKAIALVSCLTSLPCEELLELDKEIRRPSDSTRKRLNKELKLELDRLAPCPASTLFDPPAYASVRSGGSRAHARIDAVIAAAYGRD